MQHPHCFGPQTHNLKASFTTPLQIYGTKWWGVWSHFFMGNHNMVITFTVSMYYLYFTHILSLCQLKLCNLIDSFTKVDFFCNNYWWCLLLKHTSAHLFQMRYGTLKSYLLTIYVKDVQLRQQKNVGTWLFTL